MSKIKRMLSALTSAALMLMIIISTASPIAAVDTDFKYGDQLYGASKYFYNELLSTFQANGDVMPLKVTLSLKGGNYSFEAATGAVDGFYNLFTADEKASYDAAVNRVSNDVKAAINALNCDYPKSLWWMNTYGTSYGFSSSTSDSTTYQWRISSITATFTAKAAYSGGLSNFISEMNTAIGAATGDVLASSPTDRYSTVVAINNYLTQKLTYQDGSYSHEPYGAFCTNTSVCEGYAEAFKILCDNQGIPCVLISGTAAGTSGYEGHEWNYVQMENGKWYLVDCTWNDQPDSSFSNKYLLVGSNDIGLNGQYVSVSHLPDGNINDGGYVFLMPTLSENSYNDDVVSPIGAYSADLSQFSTDTVIINQTGNYNVYQSDSAVTSRNIAISCSGNVTLNMHNINCSGNLIQVSNQVNLTVNFSGKNTFGTNQLISGISGISGANVTINFIDAEINIPGTEDIRTFQNTTGSIQNVTDSIIISDVNIPEISNQLFKSESTDTLLYYCKDVNDYFLKAINKDLTSDDLLPNAYEGASIKETYPYAMRFLWEKSADSETNLQSAGADNIKYGTIIARGTTAENTLTADEVCYSNFLSKSAGTGWIDMVSDSGNSCGTNMTEGSTHQGYKQYSLLLWNIQDEKKSTVYAVRPYVKFDLGDRVYCINGNPTPVKRSYNGVAGSGA